ncbi:MAG: glycoside hydrolase family 5 protein [Povalibacter sp.]
MQKIVALLVLLIAAPLMSRADDGLSPGKQVATMMRGVNIVGYDPLWKDPSKARFQLRHMKTIKDGGFHSVRIVLQAFSHMEENDKLPEQWFATLNELVEAALKQDLTVILDEHDYNGCARDYEACHRKLLAFWKQVGWAYQQASQNVVFEILNEPNGILDEQWNSLLADALEVIRKTNPTRNVIVGPAHWNNVHWLDKLELPRSDKHLIVTVHYYLPMRFTHQGARWAPENKELGVTWGTPEERAAVEKDFDEVQAWSEKHDRPILLGEFGAYDKGPMPSRVAYTDFVARAAEKRGWAWAYWQFDSDFIVYDLDKDRWIEPIHHALIPSSN